MPGRAFHRAKTGYTFFPILCWDFSAVIDGNLLTSHVDYADLSNVEQGQLLNLLQEILVLVAGGVDEFDITNQLCRLAEVLLPDSVATVMILDDDREFLQVYAAPRLPPDAVQRLNRLKPGPGSGSCGNAIYRGEPQFVSDTFTDARWDDSRQIAYDFDVRACWSMPILSGKNPGKTPGKSSGNSSDTSSDTDNATGIDSEPTSGKESGEISGNRFQKKPAGGHVIGTFALSSFEHGMPTPFHRILLSIGASIAGIVLQRKDHEAALRIAAIAFESQDGVMVTDSQARILRVNRAFCDITGYAGEEVIGNHPDLLHSGRQGPEFYAAMWETIRQSGHWSGEVWNRRKNGEMYPEHLTITAVKDDSGNITNYVGSMLDISERKRSEDKIHQMAYFDQVTGLPNRRLFLDRLEQDASRVAGIGSSLALVYIDLDRFKEVNDTLGHNKGDVLLVEAARRILRRVRKGDTVARVGGDEFAIIMPEVPDTAVIDRIMQDILRDMQSPFSLGDTEFGHISCSAGIALYPDDAPSIEELFKHADQAMYAAKKRGRSQFSYFTALMDREAREKRELTNDLRYALSVGQMKLHYQPIIDLTSGRIVKAEALLRWDHPNRGPLSPATFIPLAEESGIIHDLGNWVCLQAVSSVVVWHSRCGREVQVSVNRSPVEFDRKEFRWVDVLESAGLTGKSLVMEITEGLLLADSDHVCDQLLLCRQNGIEVALDDFGTGFSSLSYLKQFDIDYLKIDRSFVANLAASDSSSALVEAIIVMAHKLDIETIAEGVETRAQHDLLCALKCDFAQGYLYSPPLPMAQFEAMLVADTRFCHKA